MNGVPHGLILSSNLFNLYTIDVPLPTHLDIYVLSYADDTALFLQLTDPEIAATHFQNYIFRLEQWFHTKRLKVSPTKSFLTLITLWNIQQSTQPTFTLSNTPIRYPNTPTTYCDLERPMPQE